MIVNQTPYPLSFAQEKGQTLVARYGEEGRQYVLQPDVDVSGLVASLQIVKPDNTFVIASADIVEPEEGPAYIVCTIPLQATAVKGIGHYSLYIQDDADMIIYSAEGQIWIDDHLITDEMIESIAEVYGYRFPQDFFTVDMIPGIVEHILSDILDDDITSETTTWSSIKIQNEIDQIDIVVSETATGNPIEINDAAAAPLVKCVTDITGYQEGTGTPSPDNIRPIVAYSTGTIEIEDGDGNTTTYTTSFPDTIYRGSEDVVNGTESHDMVAVDIGSLSWSYDNVNARFYSIDIRDYIKKPSGYTDVPNVKCSQYEVVAFASLNNLQMAFGNNGNMFVKDSRYTDAPTFTAAMSGVQIAYELDTPTTTHVNPTNPPIKSLNGYNHIESSTGEMEIEYIKAEYQSLVDVIEHGDMHIYSTQEQIVGKWIDGTTIYERAYTFSTPISITSSGRIITSLIDNISEIDKIHPNCVAFGDHDVSDVYINFNAGVMTAYIGVGMSSCSGIILRYSKTS